MPLPTKGFAIMWKSPLASCEDFAPERASGPRFGLALVLLLVALGAASCAERSGDNPASEKVASQSQALPAPAVHGASTSANAKAKTSLSISRPSLTTAGDVLVAFIASGVRASYRCPPSGAHSPKT